MKSLFICICCLFILLAFAIGLISGLVIIKVEDLFEDGHRNNLLILYNVER